MSQSVSADPPPAEPAPLPDTASFRQHPAFCQLSLPTAPFAGTWRRDTANVAMTIEAAEPPHGPYLRLILLHLFDAALRAGSPTVEVGANAAELAARIGLPLSEEATAELGTQFTRLIAAKTSLAQDGGAALSVFDARTRPKTADWRTSVKLNARFYASLAEVSVLLDRKVIASLLATPVAMDAYGWIVSGLSRITGNEGPLLGWDDLLQRFGAEGETPEAFRTSFEETLRQVTEACPAVSVIVAEAGCAVRRPSPPMRPDTPRERPARPAPLPPPPAPAPSAAPLAAQLPATTPAPLPAPLAAAEQPPRPPRPAAPPAATPAPALPPPPAPPVIPVQMSANYEAHQRAPRHAVSLKSNLTGLNQVIWLQRAQGRDSPLIEVTPGGRYDPDNVTVLALEPMIVQISGGLYERDFEKVASWAMSNRDLIDDFWEGQIEDIEAVLSRVKKVPAPGWR